MKRTNSMTKLSYLCPFGNPRPPPDQVCRTCTNDRVIASQTTRMTEAQEQNQHGRQFSQADLNRSLGPNTHSWRSGCSGMYPSFSPIGNEPTFSPGASINSTPVSALTRSDTRGLADTRQLDPSG